MTHDVTMETFESVVDGHSIVILDFWAGWCKPCKIFEPVFEQLSELHPDIYFGKVNTESAPELAEAFRVRSIPTLMAFKGAELVYEQAGVMPVEAFQELVKKLRELPITPGESAPA